MKKVQKKEMPKPRWPRVPYEMNYYVDKIQDPKGRKIRYLPFMPGLGCCLLVTAEKKKLYDLQIKVGLVGTEFEIFPGIENKGLHLGKEFVEKESRIFMFAQSLEKIKKYPAKTIVIGIADHNILWRKTVRDFLEGVVLRKGTKHETRCIGGNFV